MRPTSLLRRIRQNATYANVMSSIAVFVAVSTGGAYAATKLAPNSVRSTNIVNGQVAYADLAPAVRARLGSPTKPSTGGKSGAIPGLVFAGEAAPCNCEYPTPISNRGDLVRGPFVNQRRIDAGFSSMKRVELRLTGTVTNPTDKVALVNLQVYGSPTANNTLAGPVLRFERYLVPGETIDLSKISPQEQASSGMVATVDPVDYKWGWSTIRAGACTPLNFPVTNPDMAPYQCDWNSGVDLYSTWPTGLKVNVNATFKKIA